MRPLIEKEIDQLTSDALSQGEMTEEAARRLKQLSDLETSIPKPPAHPARRWPLILLLFGIFLIPGLMISLRVPKVEVQISVLVSEVAWLQQQSGEVLPPLKLASLYVSSFSTISLPLTREIPAEDLVDAPVSFAVSEGASGQVSLDAIHAESGVRVALARAPAGTGATVYLSGVETSAKIVLAGVISVKSGNNMKEERDFGRGRPASARASDTTNLGLDMRFEGEPDVHFPAHIMISDLSLNRVEEADIKGKRRSVSTVLSGEIYNESMNGSSYKLRKSEWLTLEGVNGELRSMQMTERGIQFDYHGEVTGIEVGSNNNRRSLMPNWLEWFGARHSVKMLWGAFIWLTTTLFGVIKWWKRPQ